MKSSAVIAVLFLVLTQCPIQSYSADEKPADDAAKRDLDALQGKWETTLRTRGGKIRNVQTIDDTSSTVERFNEDGDLVHKHTAKFKLRITDDVRVFTFFDLVVTDGPQKGAKFKGPRSYVYVLQRNSWFEARGVMVDQDDGEPRILAWKRIQEKVAAQPALLR